ncbi:hypothetical protein BZA77DRAFT_355288 [Pyronema omphalodes]|nr:hypothetical protein BZA77DRAFT_355288 [Pyronema omphalodes]
MHTPHLHLLTSTFLYEKTTHFATERKMMFPAFLFSGFLFLQLFAAARGFGLLRVESRDASNEEIGNRPYILNDTMPRCIHLLANYTSIANRPASKKHGNILIASEKAYDLIETWCGHHKQENSTIIVADSEKWWYDDEIVTDFDREFMKNLEQQKDKDLVFELIYLAYNLGTRPLNVFLWKVLLNLYEGEPADKELWYFLTGFELNTEAPNYLPEVTDYWLEDVITEKMLPFEHATYEEMESLPVMSTFMLETMKGHSVT